jgi:demethylmenaquinone methyltransferase/2-methoxy-6-polyprenyl-1,4-benzoquinol methylase
MLSTEQTHNQAGLIRMRNDTPEKLNPESTWFGFRPVDAAAKAGMVRQVFDSVAGRYDVMNDVMSGGLHRLWKDRLVGIMRPEAGQVILDVAGGTGDIALRCYRRTNGQARITVCDINRAMLMAGKAKAVDQGILPNTNRIKWIEGNAESLPAPNASIDSYCIAFGLRNVTHIDQALAEAFRVLKPGGKFYCLEFSPGVSPALKPIYDAYCLGVLPVLGRFIAKDRDAYQYLGESIQKFPPQAELAKRMRRVGFEQVKWLNLTGGIAVIHSGWKL